MKNCCCLREIRILLSIILITGVLSSEEEQQQQQQQQPQPQPQQRDLIVGGKEANPGDFPYYVHLIKCGGSLISPKVVLTAAHCGNFSGYTATVGCHVYGKATGDAVDRKVSKQVIHPDYNSDTYNHDFNLLLLDEAVTLSDSTDIVLELNEDDLVPTDGQEVTVLGLGLLEESGDTPEKVRYVEVEKTADEFCNDAYGGDIEDSIQFCAGVDGGGKDACQGDSGGPLIVDFGKRHVQVGVVSSGTGCASPDYPGIYARVSGEMDWIRSIVCDEWEQTDATFCPTTAAAKTGRSAGGATMHHPRSHPLEWFRIQSKNHFTTTMTTMDENDDVAHCLSLEHGRVAVNGESIVMLPCDGTYQQQWTQFDNDFLIRSKMNPNKCVRVKVVDDDVATAAAAIISSSVDDNTTETSSSSIDEKSSGDTLAQLELYDCFNSESTPFEAYSDGTIRLKEDDSQCWEYYYYNNMEGRGLVGIVDCNNNDKLSNDNNKSQQWKTTLRQDDVLRTKSAVKTVLASKHNNDADSVNDEPKIPRDGTIAITTTPESKHVGATLDESITHDSIPKSGSFTHVPHEPRDQEDYNNGTNDWFGIKNVKTNTCLTLQDGGLDDLTLIVLEPCGDDDNYSLLLQLRPEQQWIWNGHDELQSMAASHKCVVPSGDATLGSAMLIYECQESNMYGQWTIPEGDSGSGSGSVSGDSAIIGPIVSNEDPSKCLSSHTMDSVVTLEHCPEDEAHIRDDRLWQTVW
ncbi:unnamed protein product [Cylindrotheca closterium]|uniref:Peptidase S1 domain-containing protein n=1 Tax=Cylindrotheca closterium TaxID=2856 RepID=A0AAD2CMF8_9STRA|nr:unnamed protein product [Cylindrotheca closterium]